MPKAARIALGPAHADAADPAQAGLAVKIAALGLLATGALALPSSTPGVTSTEILIGGTVPLSGSASAFGTVGPGANAYFKYVNAHGGVFGRKIRYLWRDDGYDPSRTIEADARARPAGQGLRDLQHRRHRAQRRHPRPT